MKGKFIIFILLFAQFSFSQETKSFKTDPNTFQVTNVSSDNLKDMYIKAITKGNFNAYRLKNKVRVLEFVDGVKVKLDPAEKSQVILKKERYPNAETYPTIFKLDEKSGIIIELHDSSKEGSYKYNNK